MVGPWVACPWLLAWVVVLLFVCHSCLCTPVYNQDVGCNVTNACVICPQGFQPSHSFMRRTAFYATIKCLELSKGDDPNTAFLQGFSQLEKLELHGFYFPSLSKDNPPIFGYTNLTHLVLSRNRIKSLASNVFQEISVLRHLDLSQNEIEEVQSAVFSELVNLEFLTLGGNLIVTIPVMAFSGLSNLKELHLYENRLTFLRHELFLNLTSLENLDLSGNSLKVVPAEVVNDFARLLTVSLHDNPWDCSCTADELSLLLNSRPELAPKMPICKTPLIYKGILLSELPQKKINCSAPLVMSVSDSQDYIIAAKVTLSCQAAGYPAPAILWVIPTGDYFGHPSGYHLLDQSQLGAVRSKYTYVFGDRVMKTHVAVMEDGQITIDGFRGGLRGNYTCLAVNPAGVDTANVTLTVHSGVPVTYIDSLVFCAQVSAGFIVFGIVAGIISFIVNRSNNKKDEADVKLPNPEQDEASEAFDINSESIGDSDQDFDHSPPPGGSPVTVNASPGKCPTPNEEYDKLPEFPDNIIETLDEVRWRLRHGVERKIERVRTHVLTIKSSGSQYIDTIRSSSSHAANRVRAGVVMGMEQVKYGVQSIKEFCGTGDMGGQTVSVVSVSTDVDTQESVQTIKTTTFV